jgi:hypothetical protein
MLSFGEALVKVLGCESSLYIPTNRVAQPSLLIGYTPEFIYIYTYSDMYIIIYTYVIHMIYIYIVYPHIVYSLSPCSHPWQTRCFASSRSDIRNMAGGIPVTFDAWRQQPRWDIWY